MNPQTANSNLISNSSASGNFSSLIAPDEKPEAMETVPPHAPTPKADISKSKSPAKANARKAAAAKNEDRCRHYTATGRRCRLTVLDPTSGLCFRHVGLQFQPTDEDLSPAFGGLVSELQSACGIHDFLSQLTVLLVQNRISTRRAAILAYLSQILLRTLPAIQDELGPDQPQIIFDLPRPKRDDDVSPERAMVNRWAERYGSASRPSAPGTAQDNPAAKEST